LTEIYRWIKGTKNKGSGFKQKKKKQESKEGERSGGRETTGGTTLTNQLSEHGAADASADTFFTIVILSLLSAGICKNLLHKQT